jgi:hypothetical protein
VDSRKNEHRKQSAFHFSNDSLKKIVLQKCNKVPQNVHTVRRPTNLKCARCEVFAAMKIPVFWVVEWQLLHCAGVRVTEGISRLWARSTHEYSNLVGIREGKRPLGRHKHRWEDNIRIDLRKIGWEIVDWIHLAQCRDQWWAHANMVMNPRDP